MWSRSIQCVKLSQELQADHHVFHEEITNPDAATAVLEQEEAAGNIYSILGGYLEFPISSFGYSCDE